VVLPFSNLSSGGQSRYLSSGLTEELTESLSRSKALRVIASTSTAQFNGKKVDVREAGRTLHVMNVVEGSIDQEGDRVKVAVRLERVTDGALLWSNSYDRPAAELVAVQAELASGIARALKITAGIKPQHVPNAAAHDMVLKARYDTQLWTTESLARAESEYQQAIHLDPQYPAAYMGLGTVQWNKAGATGLSLRTDAERASAERAFQKALELDPPGLSAARVVLAIMAMQHEWDWDRAERELQLALASSPNATAESNYAFLQIFRGNFAEADRPFEEKYPDPGVSMAWFAAVYAFMGDEANSLKWLERSADRHEWAALSVAIGPIYTPMRSSAGFRALEKRMGLLP